VENKNFYVYAFLRSADSVVGPKYSPYYIGKGSKNRAFSSKRVIARPNDDEFVVFIQEGLTEAEAYSLEKYCVAFYGRINNGTGILRNLIDGGQGGFEHVNKLQSRTKIIYTEEQLLKNSLANAQYEYELTSPGGEIYTALSLRRFAKEHGIDQSSLSKVANNIHSQYKGWKCRKIRKL